MLKILTVFFCVLVLRVRPDDKAEENDEEPKLGKFPKEQPANQFLNRHLLNMTESLCKDSMYKLRMAHLIQMDYRISKGYELGTVASGLMDTYRHLILVYRYYSNSRNFRNTDHSIEQLLNGYAIMQGDYNELVAETVLYYQVLDRHLENDNEQFAEARALAKKHGVSVNAIRQLQRKGVKLSDVGLARRSMQTETKLRVNVGKLPEGQTNIPRHLLLEDPKNINIWTPKKQNNSQEEKYKKKLRYTKWAEGWKGFDGETEGVHIDDSIARLGLSNDSDFLLKELKGVV